MCAGKNWRGVVMKVPYGEGLATHTGPESCVYGYKGIESVNRGCAGQAINYQTSKVRSFGYTFLFRIPTESLVI